MPHRRASALPPQCHFTTAVPKYISGRTSYLQVRLEFHRLPQVIPAFCNRPGFGPPRTYSARFTLLMVRSPGFGSPACDSYRPFGLAFASAPPVLRLNLATYNNSLAHSTKGTPSPRKGGSDRPEAHGFRISFTPLLGVLFTVPSRYWCTIGRLQYLALGCGHPCFPPDFACPAVLTFRSQRHASFGYGSLTLSGRLFQYRSPHHHLTVAAQERGPDRRPTPTQQRLLPHTLQWVWAPPGSLAATSGILSFPRGTLDVSVPPVPSAYQVGRSPVSRWGCPIRTPWDRWLPAPPPGFSQRGHVLHRL